MRKQGAAKNRSAALAVANKEIQLELLKLLGNDLMDLKFDGDKVTLYTRKELDKETLRDAKGLLRAQVVDFDPTQKPEMSDGLYSYSGKNKGSPLLASVKGITILNTK